MTNYDVVKNMSVEEMARSNIKEEYTAFYKLGYCECSDKTLFTFSKESKENMLEKALQHEIE